MHQSAAAVVYRCSWLRRIYAWLVIGLLLIFVELFVALFLWIGAPHWILGANAPIPSWWHVVACFGLFAVAIMVVRWISRSIPSQIILRDDLIELGGAVFRRRIPYERIRIVQLEKHKNTLDRSLELRIVRQQGGTLSIHLPQNDARECFHAIHGMSDATAMDVDDAVYAPLNPELADRGRSDVARVYRQRAVRSWVIAGALFAYGGLAIASLLFWSPPNQGRAWTWAILGPLLAIGAAGNAIRNHRLAANILTAPTERDAVLEEV